MYNPQILNAWRSSQMSLASRVLAVAFCLVVFASGPALAGKNKTIDALAAAIEKIEKSDIEKSAALSDAVDEAKTLKKDSWKFAKHEVYGKGRALFGTFVQETQGSNLDISMPSWL